MAACLSHSVCSRHIGENVTRQALAALRAASQRKLSVAPLQHCRFIQRAAAKSTSAPRFAFAFDIDGVLLRSSNPLPGAQQSLEYLQRNNVPFILLTNGGGKSENERVAELSAKLSFPLSTDNFIQSHTPFASFDQYKDKTVLVVGGDGDKCRHVAHSYGFKNVIIPSDIYASDSTIWPFSRAQFDHHKTYAQSPPSPVPPVAAIFVFNDPRDWGLDLTLVIDLLLSKGGKLGTLSPLNGSDDLPNRGYQSDGQPALYFSNPDLWWASDHPLPRLGQGGFREALEGVWAAITRGQGEQVLLRKTVMGKPYRPTYAFAEEKLLEYRRSIISEKTADEGSLERVYMVGDNPESDIRGGNEWRSPQEVEWKTLLVESGVFVKGSEPKYRPTEIVGGVWDAVRWAVEEERKRSGWRDGKQDLPGLN